MSFTDAGALAALDRLNASFDDGVESLVDVARQIITDPDLTQPSEQWGMLVALLRACPWGTPDRVFGVMATLLLRIARDQPGESS